MLNNCISGVISTRNVVRPGFECLTSDCAAIGLKLYKAFALMILLKACRAPLGDNFVTGSIATIDYRGL